MDIKINFKNEEDILKILKENEDLYLKECAFLLDEKYLILTDVEPEEPKLTEIEKISILEAENEKLKVEQEQQNEEIIVNMLANTEMFEMILDMMPKILSVEEKNNKGNSNIIEAYCTLIMKTIKNVEDVPSVIRNEVIERLKQLEIPVK